MGPENRNGAVMRDGFGHERPYRGGSDDWLTPPSIIRTLGPFDLDPCASVNQPWPTATKHIAPPDDGLVMPWTEHDMVWCNPPYGPATYHWLERMNQHGRGIALTFARTETRGFVRQVWQGKSVRAVLFIAGRVRFYRPVTGERAASSGAPSCLIAFGQEAEGRLWEAAATGTIDGTCVTRHRGWV